MRSWVLAAGLLAAAATTGAQAADLYDGPPPDRYGSAYDDPRYADIYRYPRAAAALRPRVRPAAAPRGRYAEPGRSRASASTARTSDYDREYAARPARAIPTPSRPAATPTAAPRERSSRSGCYAAAGTISTTATCGATSPLCARAVRAGAFSTSSSTAAAARSSTPGRSSRAASAPTPRRSPPYGYGPQPRRWDRAY